MRRRKKQLIGILHSIFVIRKIIWTVKLPLLCVGILCAGNWAAAQSTSDGIIYVNAEASGDNTGDSWANAFVYLQDALAVANNGDEVWVAEGIYYPDQGAGVNENDRYATFNLISGVSLYGGFAGTETDRNERDIEENETILSGDVGSSDNDSYHVVTATNGDANEEATLDGFTITEGNGEGGSNDNEARGGGILVRGSSPTIRNIVLANNKSSFGGGMFIESSSPTVSNVQFTNNSATNSGGGLFIYNSDPLIQLSSFESNNANFAGGIGIQSADPKFIDVKILSNNANEEGGGMFNMLNSNPTLINVIFKANSAQSGGGLYNRESRALLYNVIISGNFADSHVNGGGAIFNEESNPVLTNITMTGNSSEGSGSGMFNSENSNPVVNNSILWNNHESDFLGDESVVNDETSTTTFHNNIIENSDGSGSSWNDEIGIDGGGNLDFNPLFVAPVDPGEAPTAEGDFHLLAGSIALDAGMNEFLLSENINTDFDGNERFIDNDGDEIAKVDLGAYEASPDVQKRSVVYVDIDASGANNGESWTDAFSSLQNALSEASYGDDLWIAEGTYLPDQGADVTEDDRSASFQLKNGVALYGGFGGTEESESERNTENNVTILSGDIGLPDFPNDNSYHVIIASGTNSDTVIDGVLVTAGNADGNDDFENGAGMYINGGSLTIKDVTFTDNTSQNNGGGMYIDSGSPQILESIFIDNTAEGGGGIFSNSSNPVIKRVTFRENNSTAEYNFDGGGGGGISNRGGNPTITQSTFIHNRAVIIGGGIRNDGGNFTIVNTTFIGNVATDGFGGGMHSTGGESTIKNTLFLENAAFGSGVTGYGHGGGLHISGDGARIINCTFYGNSADVDGGGIVGGGTDVILNTILWKNSADGDGDQIYGDDDGPYVGYSIVEGGVLNSAFNGEGNLNSDPNFIDADGPDNTAGSLDDNLQLQNGSPAIDAGRPDTTNLNLPATDLEGNVRLFDGTEDGNVIVDIGAYEYGSESPVSIDEPNHRRNNGYKLSGAYPNPFNSQAIFELTVNKLQDVRITLYDVLGRQVKMLHNGPLTTNETHRFTINGRRLSTGVYMIRVQGEQFLTTKKVTMVK